MKNLMLSKKISEQIELLLIPFFTELGFIKQDIYNYYLYRKPFIHCVNLQKRSDRKAICVNLGVHLEFLPVPARLDIPPVNEITEIDCSIRKRLTHRGRHDHWWYIKPAKKQAETIKALFQKEGTAFFKRYTSFPDVFESITIEDIESGDASKILPGMTQVRIILFLARVNEHIGQKEKTVQFAEHGLDNIGNAKALIKHFEDIIRRNKKS